MDPWGAGGFGAPRGRHRKHTGLDFISCVGDSVIAPIHGKVVHIGFPYPGSQGILGTVHLRGSEEHSHYLIKLFYLSCPMPEGAEIFQGDLLGRAQDVSNYWRNKRPEKSGVMKNHVHLELRVNGAHGEASAVNPAFYFDAPEVV
jgi:hypothetical protein